MKRTKLLVGLVSLLLLTSHTVFAESYQSVKITADRLNIREDMNIESPILGTLAQEDLIATLDTISGWYKIKYEEQVAYISADYAEVVEDFIGGSITGKHVNMRDFPSTQNSMVISQLSNTDIKVHAKKDGWYSITTRDGHSGYVFEDFVSLGQAEDRALNQTMIDQVSEEEIVSRGTYPSDLINLAKSKLGSPYKWAGEGPDAFDCSGFALYCFKEAYGINLPHSASAISLKGTRIPKDQLQAGDLVFFSTNRSGNVNHVGIYLGNGEFIHASSSSYNGRQVHINPLNKGFYNEVYKWGQRLSVE